MSDAELQEEEREVLASIYDGDAAFKEVSPTTYQYKVFRSRLFYYVKKLRIYLSPIFTLEAASFDNQIFLQYGEENDPKSFILDISWGPTYPTEKPSISMETFYNKHM